MELLTDHELIKKIETLPNLLDLAIQIEAEHPEKLRYQVQELLRDQFIAAKKPYRFSMPVRHLYTCSTNAHRAGEIHFSLCLPMGEGGWRTLAVKESEIHEISEHGKSLTETQKEFCLLL